MNFKKILGASGLILSIGMGFAKPSPRWASSIPFPQSPLMEFDGVIFTGKTNLESRVFNKTVLSRGPLRANGCTFTQLTVQGPFEGTNVTAGQVVVQGTGYMVGGVITEAITVQGQMAVRGMTIQGTVRFSGQAILDDVTVKDLLSGKGQLVAKNSTLRDVSIGGNVLASDTEFGNLEIGGVRHSFENCTLTDVTVMNRENQAASIYLRSTTVKGKIIFEGGKGTIYTDQPSLLVGKVTGGTVKTKP